jgi:hypothetical protein
MILLSLEVTPLVLLIRNNIWVNNSTIKTWVLFVIFLEMELFTLIVFSFLSQWKSALDFLFETSFLSAHPDDTPMDSTVELDDEKVTPFNDVIQNRRFVGKLIYLTITHPNITYAIGVVSHK